MAALQNLLLLEPSSTPPSSTPESMMEHILREVMAVGRQLEGMDTMISDLTAETKSICVDIAGFQDRVEGVELRLTAVEECLNTIPDRDQ
ncbi:hypothetical protein NDU88_004963 [Pleurodeles waltl]|uniref:Uncharacterized protein n=1 Tax=Pleurodeles waltl TaxID=8319 RepID=A0AAV7QDH0_PLEWA|nr:hypothetical protein NDU88_004963 [Pleurodeles waltl]